ncbi:MAG TPA: glycosyltransferase family 39 protein [Thermoanaerobaculia bacterium]|nr:glycosyltransferase family 39 protein [Thermoanaerobaculia bacterium]
MSGPVPRLVPDDAESVPEASSFLWRVVVWGALTFYLLFILRTGFVVDGEIYFTLFDDSMISLRYARNLAEGHGLVWNPGEQPPVEGYSNFLWTLWLAALHLLPLPISKMPLAVAISGALLLLAQLWVLASIAKNLTGFRRSWTGLFAVFLTAFSYPLIFWTLRGMEVGLLALLASGATLLAFRFRDEGRPTDLLGLGGCLGAAVLTRDDAITFVAVLAVYAVAAARGRRARFWVAAFLLSAVVIPKGLHLAFRWSFYGDLLPNTYYLKLGGSSLVDRIGRGLLAFGSVVTQHLGPVLAAGGLLLLGLRRSGERALQSKLLLLSVLFLAQAAYSIYVGGDAWEYMNHSNRYVAVAVPALSLLAGMGLARLGQPGGPEPRRLGLLLGSGALLGGLWNIGQKVSEGMVSPRDLAWGIAFASTGIVLSCLFLLSFRGGSGWAWTVGERPERRMILWALLLWALVNGKGSLQWVLDNAYELPMNIRMTRVGLLIRESSDPGAWVAVAAAGHTPYFSERPTIDVLGKCDRRIARMARVRDFMPGHDKTDYNYSLGELRPDIVAHYWRPRPDAARVLVAYGYERMPNGLYVARSSSRVRRDAISRDFDRFGLASSTRTASNSVPAR